MVPKLEAVFAVGAPSLTSTPPSPSTSPMKTVCGPPNSAFQIAAPSSAALKPLIVAGVLLTVVIASSKALPRRSPAEVGLLPLTLVMRVRAHDGHGECVDPPTT